MKARSMNARSGFTLLELLMVVIIISILASIALPQYLRMSERTRASEAMTMVAAIRSSELRFKAQDPAGLYTTNLTKLDIDLPGVAAGGASASSVLWKYTVSAADPGADAIATRLTGAKANATIILDVDSGGLCSAEPVYGLPATASGCP